MNVTKEDLSGIMEQIDTDADLVTRAKVRAAGKSKKKIRYKPVAAVLCAAVLVCGITVSAAALGGWTERIFGGSSALLDEDYTVEVGNVTVENAEGVPYEFTLGDVISDGQTLYMNLLVKGMEPEYEEKYGCYNFNGYVHPVNMENIASGAKHRDSMWKVLSVEDGTASTAVNVNYSSDIRKGDVIGLEFKLLDDPYIPSYTTLATISFEITNDVNNMEKVVEAGQATTLSAWKWTSGGEDIRKGTTDFYIDELRITPFKCIIRGRMDKSEFGVDKTLSGDENYYIVYKNGETKEILFDSSRGNLGDDYLYTDILISFSEVENLDEIAAVRVGDITIPVN